MTSDLLLAVTDAALRGVAVALFALLATRLWRDLPGLPLARAGASLSLGMCVQLLGAAPLVEAQAPALWQAPLVAVAVGNAVLFWLFVRALFDDDFAFRPWHLAVWAAAAGLGGLNCLIGPWHASVLVPVLRGLQRVIPLIFAVLAVWAALRQWRVDLIELRRRLRGFVLVAGVVYTVAQVAARLSSADGRLTPLVALGDVLGLLLIAGVVAGRLLRVGPSELFSPAPAPFAVPGPGPALPRETEPEAASPLAPRPQAPPDSLPPDPADERLAESLARLMRDACPYRDEGVSLASLAARLSVPEYRLRRVINQRLGHRNFNAYINGFRLADAQAALADAARRDTPVLTIALEAGFQSIGPFNRAFKAATGLTPTEFRRVHRGESLADS